MTGKCVLGGKQTQEDSVELKTLVFQIIHLSLYGPLTRGFSGLFANLQTSRYYRIYSPRGISVLFTTRGICGFIHLVVFVALRADNILRGSNGCL